MSWTLENNLNRTFQKVLTKFSWKSGSPVSAWIMPFVAIVLVIVGIEYLDGATSIATSKRSCLDSLGGNCIYFHRDISLVCFFVALCCLVAAVQISRISNQLKGASDLVYRLLKPLDVVRHLSYSAKRLSFDVAAFMTLAVLTATGASAVDGSDRIPSWERIELILFVPTVLVLLSLELIANYEEIMKRLHSFLREFLIALVMTFIVFGHLWANWSWGGIAIASATIAAINALSQWLVPNEPTANATKATVPEE